MSHIYKTTNTVNGKVYIGKEKHNDKNYIGSGRILNNAIKKYGKEVFVKEILEDCSLDIIDERECYWIDHYDSTNWDIGYNITKGGTGGDTTSLHPNKEAVIQKRSSVLNNCTLKCRQSKKNNGLRVSEPNVKVTLKRVRNNHLRQLQNGSHRLNPSREVKGRLLVIKKRWLKDVVNLSLENIKRY